MPKYERKPILPMTQERIDEFWKHVQCLGPDECWLWTAGRTKSEYGRFKIGYTEYRAHRIAFYLSRGIDSELFICHKCDCPPCCNPKHLFEGTNSDNIQDCIAKGRIFRGQKGMKGEKHGMAKLTWLNVNKIREKHKDGIHEAVLAKEFMVSRGTIWFIVNHKTWN